MYQVVPIGLDQLHHVILELWLAVKMERLCPVPKRAELGWLDCEFVFQDFALSDGLIGYGSLLRVADIHLARNEGPTFSLGQRLVDHCNWLRPAGDEFALITSMWVTDGN